MDFGLIRIGLYNLQLRLYISQLWGEKSCNCLLNLFYLMSKTSFLNKLLLLFFFHSKSPKPQKPKGKANRVWDMGGRNTGDLDYSGSNGNNYSDAQTQDHEASAEPVSSDPPGPSLGNPAIWASDNHHT